MKVNKSFFSVVFIFFLTFNYKIIFAKEYAILVGKDLESTNSFSVDGPLGHIHVNGILKNVGNEFTSSGDITVSGGFFKGNHPIYSYGEIAEGVTAVVIESIPVSCFKNQANYIFVGGEKNTDGKIMIYNNQGNLIEEIKGGKWIDPSGANWIYVAGNNSWKIISDYPSNLTGIVYFETNFLNPGKSLQINGSLFIEGNFQCNGELTINSGSSDKFALIVDGDSQFNNISKMNGNIYIKKDILITNIFNVTGWIKTSGSLFIHNNFSINFQEYYLLAGYFYVKQEYGENLSLIFSQLLKDLNGNPGVQIFVFKRGNTDSSIIHNINELSENDIQGELYSAYIGTSYDYLPDIALSNGANFLRNYFSIINQLKEEGFNYIYVSDLFYVYPIYIWANFYADGQDLGAYLLNSGRRIDPIQRDESFRNVYESMYNYFNSDPGLFQQAKEMRITAWKLFEEDFKNVNNDFLSYDINNCSYKNDEINSFKHKNSEKHLNGVPFYGWYKGCCPTAGAMGVAYLQQKGYGRLIDDWKSGDPSTNGTYRVMCNDTE